MMEVYGMRRTILISTCVFTVVTVLPSLSTAQTVDELVAKYIDARGGIERIKAIETLKITRTVGTGIGSNVNVIIYKKRPQLYRGEQAPALPGATMVPRGINAEDAWDTQGGKVVKRPEQAEAETREIDADFDGLLVGWKEKGHTVTYAGREKMPGGDAFKLQVKTKSGVDRTIYLDAATYLERRHTGQVTMLNGRKMNVVIDFSNWRDVNGVKFPFDITEDRTGDMPAQSLVIYTEKIEANVPVDDALFATPAQKL
jgi:hypothetical protein